jgi:hypothetical protein
MSLPAELWELTLFRFTRRSFRGEAHRGLGRPQEVNPTLFIFLRAWALCLAQLTGALESR